MKNNECKKETPYGKATCLNFLKLKEENKELNEVISRLVESSHMAGQYSAGIDPSYSEARAYCMAIDDMDFISDLEKENKELVAQLDSWKEQATLLSANIERLREALFNAKAHIRTEREYREAREAYEETPSQSLNHIRSQVEEETMRSSFIDGFYDGAGDDLWYRDHDDDGLLKDDAFVHHFLNEHMKTMPRKYKEQSDED